MGFTSMTADLIWRSAIRVVLPQFLKAHSQRSAVSGSTCVAVRAGKIVASAAMASRNSAAEVNTSGSAGLTPSNKLATV
jgi:hypothetical protein